MEPRLNRELYDITTHSRIQAGMDHIIKQLKVPLDVVAGRRKQMFTDMK